jgi:hypothetical protein
VDKTSSDAAEEKKMHQQNIRPLFYSFERKKDVEKTHRWLGGV